MHLAVGNKCLCHLTLPIIWKLSSLIRVIIKLAIRKHESLKISPYLKIYQNYYIEDYRNSAQNPYTYLTFFLIPKSTETYQAVYFWTLCQKIKQWNYFWWMTLHFLTVYILCLHNKLDIPYFYPMFQLENQIKQTKCRFFSTQRHKILEYINELFTYRTLLASMHLDILQKFRIHRLC